MLPVRFLALSVLTAFLVLGAHPSRAAETLPDLFAVPAQRIDASAGSAILARDAAMAQGRAEAWTKLFRRFTASSQWNKQPQLSDAQLLRLVRNVEVAGERRSTTRYLADVTYRFNPVAVRAVLRQSNVPYTDLRSKPALVIPLIDGKGFDPNHPWTAVWNDPMFLQGLVPMIPVQPRDMGFLSRSDLMQLDWEGFQPLIDGREIGEVVLAIASEDGNTLQVIEITEMGRDPSAFGFAMSDVMANAAATVDAVVDSWKDKNALDFGTRGRFVADVQFENAAEWTRIRSQLRAVRAVTGVDVIGVSFNEAEISVSYFGRIEQFKDLLAQQNLVLAGPPNSYSIEARRAAAAAVP